RVPRNAGGNGSHRGRRDVHRSISTASPAIGSCAFGEATPSNARAHHSRQEAQEAECYEAQSAPAGDRPLTGQAPRSQTKDVVAGRGGRALVADCVREPGVATTGPAGPDGAGPSGDRGSLTLLIPRGARVREEGECTPRRAHATRLLRRVAPPRATGHGEPW